MEKEKYERIIREKDKIIREKDKIIRKNDKIIKKQNIVIEGLRIQINQTERRLLAYENAHTPPSKQKFPKKKEKKELGKLGAKKGHPKYTRPEPIADKIIVYDQINEKYQDRELAFLAQRIHYEEEIPEVQPVFVTKHVINMYIDLNSGEIISAENNAPKGAFGKNAETHITLLKFADRLPLRKVEESLQRQHHLKITNVGIYKIVRRVSQKLNVPYYEIIKVIRSSGVLYIDETQFKVNGKTWWLWVSVSANTTLFVLRDSRGEEVIKEILGKDFRGKISADGWVIYKNFAKILQRCWAHLLRESKELFDKYADFNHLHRKIKHLFDKICKIPKNPPPLEERKKLRQKMENDIEFVGKLMTWNSRFKILGTKILNGLDAWFTCIEHLDIEPTNNFAEQALREPIVQRKIMGGLRSKDGAIIIERVCTCIATWKKQEVPLFDTLKSYL